MRFNFLLPLRFIVLSLLSAYSLSAVAIDLEIAYSLDDNVTRAGSGYDYSDSIISASISKSFKNSTSNNSQLVYRFFTSLDQYSTYDKLSRVAAGVEGALQFRPSGSFTSPTFSLLAKAYAEDYKSSLRSGIVYKFGASIKKPVTDRISITGIIEAKERDASSKVFKNSDVSTRVNFDYLLSRKSTLYFSYNYLVGDIVLSAPWAPPYSGYSYDKEDNDDAFGAGWRAYRFDATTRVTTLGFNYMINENNSIDVSMVSASSIAYGGVSYTSTTMSLAYLKSF